MGDTRPARVSHGLDEQGFVAAAAGFVRLLRSLGIPVSPAQSADVLVALGHINVLSRMEVYAVLRCLLVRRREDLSAFDRAFATYWRTPDKAAVRQDGTAGANESDPSPPDQSTADSTSALMPPDGDSVAPAEGQEQGGPELHHPDHSRSSASSHINEEAEPEVYDEAYSYSRAEAVWDKDLRMLTASELVEAQRLLLDARWSLPTRQTRRLIPANRGTVMDQRRMTRDAIRFGGEVPRIHRRRRRHSTRPLVFIVDASGSMEPFTRMLLRFAHVLRRRYRHAEAFVFSTRLTRITHDLRTVGPDAALGRIAEHATDLAGGTRIGESLHTFNRVWARRVLGRGEIVVIVSDGWDQGDLGLLAQAMSHLQRNCYRLVWLSPLLGRDGYVPRAAGITTALPFIDDFLPAHNIDSLRRLTQHLARVDSSRPVRSQSARSVAHRPHRSAANMEMRKT